MVDSHGSAYPYFNMEAQEALPASELTLLKLVTIFLHIIVMVCEPKINHNDVAS